jgi:hypothetical protein
MQDKEFGTRAVRQTPIAAVIPVASVGQLHSQSAVTSINAGTAGQAPSPLLTKAAFRALLGGMSDRRFDELRAAGIIGAPLELSPRVPRWTHADYQETLARLPRRKPMPEPETLSTGRRERIERMKRGIQSQAGV